MEMNTLIKNKDLIPDLKEQIKKEGLLFNHTAITNCSITDKCISIVMTASNRSEQTYFTLKTIAASTIKNVQVILVDDSTTDCCRLDELAKLPLYIDFITIINEKKRWLNPVINYNIGFKYIKGDKIIIQNAEVCYNGDILADLVTRIQDNNYYVYDVRAVLNFEGNCILHKASYEYSTINELPIYEKYYQSRENNRNLHFLVGLTANTFKSIDSEFSYDYTYGFAYDDDDLLLKILAARLNIVNIHYDEHNIYGIHQYHKNSTLAWGLKHELNKQIIELKQKYYNMNNIYIDLTKNLDEFYDKLSLLFY